MTSSHRSDRSWSATLIEQARLGDAEAREKLFRLSRSYLAVAARAQVETWLRVKVDASDVVQQTLLEAHQGFPKFQGSSEGEWLAWLRRILTNNLADMVRRYRTAAKRNVAREVSLQATRPLDDSRPAFEPQAHQSSPSQQLLQRENLLLVTAAMEQLSADHREVIFLRNLMRLPFDEVARRMGRSRPAVQMLWMRAIRKLQQLLRDAEDEHDS